MAAILNMSIFFKIIVSQSKQKGGVKLMSNARRCKKTAEATSENV